MHAAYTPVFQGAILRHAAPMGVKFGMEKLTEATTLRQLLPPSVHGWVWDP